MTAFNWLCRHLLPRLGLLALLAGGTTHPVVAQATCPAGYSVQTQQRGYLAALCVADGGYVTRGQVVAKLEAANGSSSYVYAPAGGRLRFVSAASGAGGPLPAHTVLGVVEASAPAKRLALNK